MKNIARVVFVIIATLVGAGFASGKEIYSFFFSYGISGIFGIIISSFIICFVIYKVLKICVVNDIDSYEEFCDFIINRKLSRFLNDIVNILLLITFYIMIAGFSSFLHQEFNLNKIIGSTIVLILCYITFQKNINGLINISNYLIPILIIFLIFISSKNIDISNNYQKINYLFQTNRIDMPIIKSVLYGSYNCILLIPVLVSLKNIASNKKYILPISIISFILIVALSLAVCNVLLLGNQHIFSLEMPIIQIVKKYGALYKNLYLIMIGISIYTTAISTGCGFLNGHNQSKEKFKRTTIIMCLSAIFLSQISFTTLVNLLYPVLGIFGILEIYLIFKLQIKKQNKFARKPCKK